MFVDDVTIEVAGGNGGGGCASLLREKSKPKGGPDGGDGGDGGSIYIVHDNKLQSLQNYKNRKKIRAPHGNPGMKFKKHGKSGADLKLGVPAGTVVIDVESGETLAEISNDLSSLLVARGGKGGRGNQHFATSRNQAPRRADDGAPGEKRTLRLSFYIRADAALVGLANSGKSSLAAALAGTDFEPLAHPFSTKLPTPLLCTLAPWMRAVVLDLPSVRPPGDAERENENRFLRHLRNAKALVYTLDAASDVPPARQLEILRDAAARYDEEAGDKKEIILVTRTDIAPPDSEVDGVQSLPGGAIPISLTDKDEIEKVRDILAKFLENVPQ